MTLLKLIVTFSMTLSFATDDVKWATGGGDEKPVFSVAAPWAPTYPKDGGPAPVKDYFNVCSEGAPSGNMNTPATIPFKVFNYIDPATSRGDERFGVRKDESCEMALNPIFAQVFRAFVPKCAAVAAQS